MTTLRMYRSLFTFLLLASLVAPPLAAADRAPDLSGLWRLNEEESEDPRTVMKRDRGGLDGFGTRPGGRDSVPGGGPVGPPTGRTGRGGGPPGREGDRLEAARAVKELTIELSESLITIRDALDNERLFSTEVDGVDTIGDKIVYEARWKKKGRLVTKRDTTWGTELTETYELSDDGSQLFVTVRMAGENRSADLQFRRVYERQIALFPQG